MQRVARPALVLRPERLTRWAGAALVALVVLIELYIWHGIPGFPDFDVGRGAAQRLADGHPLYALGPGDLPVRIRPPFWTSPMLYPPALAVLWSPVRWLSAEPLVALVCAASVAWATFQAARMTTLAGLVALAALAPAIAEHLGGGNVSSLLIAALLVAWMNRDKPWAAIPLGIIAGLKIAPLVLGLWLVSAGRWRSAAWFAAAACAVFLVGLPTGQTDEWLAQLRWVPATSGHSFSELFLIPWLTPWVFASLAVGSLVLGFAGNERASFASAIAAFTLGTPLLFLSTLAMLVPAIAVALQPRRLDREAVAVVGGDRAPQPSGAQP